jgi:hypothetical protein
MARVFLSLPPGTSRAAALLERSDIGRLLRVAVKDSRGRHMTIDHPDDADIVLFGWSKSSVLRDVRKHFLRRNAMEKSFAVFAADDIFPMMPGVFACLRERDHDPAWAVSGAYLRVAENTNIGDFGPLDECQWLFGFAGSAKNHKVRQRLRQISHPRSYNIDTSHLAGREKQRDRLRNDDDDYIIRYAELLRSTKFVLCPRGVGPSSWRLFETMKAARVPVIIADEWVPPEGPDWGSCSIRVPEADVDRLPRLLEEMEPQAGRLARNARSEWERYFAEDTIFSTIVDACVGIQNRKVRSVRLTTSLQYAKLWQPRHFKPKVRYLVRRTHLPLPSAWRQQLGIAE